MKKVKRQKKKSPQVFLILLVTSFIICTATYFLYSIFIKSFSPMPVQNESQINAAEMRKLVNNLVTITNDQNPKVALDTLKGMLTNDRIANECHAITHILGNTAYIKYKDVTKALTYNDEMCGSGYMHGIVEEVFSKAKNDSEIYLSLSAICAPENLGICFHGVGHGFMWYSSDNLDTSLSSCDSLQTPYKQNNCFDGVFMENFEGDRDIHPTKFINPQNPSFPCTQIGERYKESCYFYSVRYYLELYPKKYMDAFSWCRTIEPGYAYTCIKGVGSAMMKQNLNEPLLVASFCDKTNSSDERTTCIDGMVSYYLTNYFSVSRGLSMCNKLFGDDRAVCINSTASRKDLFPD